MKKTTIFLCWLTLVMLASCDNKKDDSSVNVKSETTTDMSSVKTEIQEIENKWADAQNKKDVNALMALYADDAVSMPDGEPTLIGKAAIQSKLQKDFATPAKYASIAFETLDVYGQGDAVTEVGKNDV